MRHPLVIIIDILLAALTVYLIVIGAVLYLPIISGSLAIILLVCIITDSADPLNMLDDIF